MSQERTRTEHPPSDCSPDEIDARIDDVRRELSGLYALRGQQLLHIERTVAATVDSPSEAGTPASASRRFSIADILSLGGRALRQLLRSPKRLLSDVDRYLAHRRHQPDEWTAPARGPIEVENRLQDVWPLNIEVRSGQTAKVNLLLPSLRKHDLTGGPNTALNLFARLAARGVPVRFIATDCELDADESYLRRHLHSVSGLPFASDKVEFACARDRSSSLQLGADDILCATAWWTAQMIKEIQPRLRTRRFWYLIQDFEPGMYPWSAKQALAAETYALDYHSIVCGRLLADHLSAQRIGRFADPQFAADCLVFEPAVDVRRFSPDFDSFPNRKRRLLFYARPQAPRNLFEMGLVALKLAAEQGAFPPSQWELGFLGADLPPADLGQGISIQHHAWRSYDDYARLLRQSDVGLSLMLSPHTSYPPLEMAACGATVVTNTFGVKSEQRLRQISDNLLPVEPRLESIVAGILAAVARTDQLPQRFAGSVLNLPPDWDAALEPLVSQLEAIWNSRLQNCN